MRVCPHFHNTLNTKAVDVLGGAHGEYAPLVTCRQKDTRGQILSTCRLHCEVQETCPHISGAAGPTCKKCTMVVAGLRSNCTVLMQP
jgi:hypothetical protein